MNLILLQKIANYAIELIFPKKCLVCGQFGDWLCSNCVRNTRVQTKQYCLVCNQSSVNGLTHPACVTKNTVDGIFIAGCFEQLQDLIHAFKYSLVKDLAEQLVLVYENFIKQNNLENFISSFCVTPVPLHQSRLRWRGFNQSELLAKNFAQRFNLPFYKAVLKRTKNTLPQTKLDRSHRKANVSGAFASQSITNKIVRGKNILLIDDVCTTGATLNECAKILKKSDAKTVWGLVLARG